MDATLLRVIRTGRPAGRAVIFAAGVLVLVIVLGVTGLVSPGERPLSPRDQAVVAAKAFLDRYVEDDGRVVRRDQGGDTVSEGQAYAMLFAAAIGDEQLFETVWTWTRDNLQRKDGLIAWRWENGGVVDSESASDADLDAARALLLASDRFHQSTYEESARRLASSIMKTERVSVGGRPLIVAGPWGRPAPHVINPGYFSPRAHAVLGPVTGDWRWSASRNLTYELLEQLQQGSGPLLPDWAKVTPTGDPFGVGAPGTDAAPLYSFDATRAFVRLAEDCSPRGRAVAARAWAFFDERRGGAIANTYGLQGKALDDGEHAAGVVAAAASANAAGRQQASRALLDRASDLDREAPTYFGSAMVALGRLALDTELLGDCPPPSGGDGS